MRFKFGPVFATVLAILLLVPSFFLYRSNASEHQIRVQKESELSEKQEQIRQKETQITELNQTLSSLRETSSKTINSLELTAREREESAKSLKDELENLRKDNETTESVRIEKNREIVVLNDRLTALQKEKDNLIRKVDELKGQIVSLQKIPVPPPVASDEQPSKTQEEPFGMASDKDLGLNIDVVNLGAIVLSKASGRAARVQEINPIYDFVIIDAGEKDNVHEGMVINIVRNNSLIGKALVRHARPNVSAALVLPEWKKAVIQKGDLVTQF